MDARIRPDEHLGEGIGHGAGPTPTTTQCGPRAVMAASSQRHT